MKDFLHIPGLGSGETVDRVDSGSGQIREHTIEIGNTVIAVNNIGTMTLFGGKRGHGLLVVGVVVAFIGLNVRQLSTVLGLCLVLAGAALIAWNFLRPVDVFLSIGSSDGRRTHIVSKDRRFLSEIRDFIRKKIDTRSAQTASINITAGTISGGIAVGDKARATGVGGSVFEAAEHE